MRQTKTALTLISLFLLTLIIIISAVNAEFVVTQDTANEDTTFVLNYPEKNTPDTSLETQKTYFVLNKEESEAMAENEFILQFQNQAEAEKDNNFIITNYALSRDFSVFSKNSEINICSCSGFIDRLVIQNTGNIKETYEIYTDKDYSSVSHERVTLSPGQYTIIINYIIPGCNEFEDELRATITSSNGISKELTQKINVALCKNINASVQIQDTKTYPCTPVKGKLNLTNNLNFPEIYTLNSKILKDSITFSENPLNISAFGKKSINFTILTSCDKYGIFNESIIISTEYTKLEERIPINLNIEKRYRYDVTSPDSFEACNNLETWIPITIKNNENFENTFKITTPYNFWFKVQNSTLTLSPNEAKTTYIIAKPKWRKAGLIYIQYTVTSELGNEKIKKYVIVNIPDCHKTNIIADKEKTICSNEKEISFTLQNLGSKEANYNITISGFDEKIFKKAIIGPNDTVEIPIFLNLTDRKQTYYLKIKAFDGYFSKTAKMTLNTKPLFDCYKAEIIAPSTINVDKSGALNNITIKNIGIRTGDYKLTLNAPVWVKISRDEITLKQDKSDEIKLLTAPKNITGRYKSMLTATELNSGQKYTKLFIIKANEKTLSQKTKDFFANSYQFIKNNVFKIVITLIIILALIIVALLAIIIYRKHKRKQNEARKLIVRPSLRRNNRRKLKK